MFNLELDNQYQTSYGLNVYWGEREQKIKISLNNLGPSQFPLNKKHQGKYLTNLVFNLSFYFSIEARPDSNFHQSDIRLIRAQYCDCPARRGEERRGDTQ